MIIKVGEKKTREISRKYGLDQASQTIVFQFLQDIKDLEGDHSLGSRMRAILEIRIGDNPQRLEIEWVLGVIAYQALIIEAGKMYEKLLIERQKKEIELVH